MRPRDWFSVGVRLFGVYVMFEGWSYLMGYIGERFGLYVYSAFTSQSAESRDRSYLLFLIGDIAFGSLLIFGAEWLTRLAFHEPTPIDDASTDDSTLPKEPSG